jgi:hypothetical protein
MHFLKKSEALKKIGATLQEMRWQPEENNDEI